MLNIKKILKEKFKRIQISFNQMNVPQNYVHFQVKIYIYGVFVFFQESDLKSNGFCCFSLLKIPKDGGNLRGIHLMVYFKNSNLTLNSSSCPE